MSMDHLKKSNGSDTECDYPIFVLSLADSLNRRALIQKQFDELGIEFQFIDAIDGRDGLDHEYESQIDRKRSIRILRRILHDSEFATTLAHLKIYQLIVDNDYKGAVVIEDDAVLSVDFKNIYLSRKFARFKFLLFCHKEAYVESNSCIDLDHDVKACKLRLSPWLTVGYYISAESAKEYIEKAYPVSQVADWCVDVTEFDAYACVPQVIRHDDVGPSGIEKGRSESKSNRPMISILDMLRRNVRKIRRSVIKRLSMKIS
jgi:glycosyl transferase family 25